MFGGAKEEDAEGELVDTDFSEDFIIESGDDHIVCFMKSILTHGDLEVLSMNSPENNGYKAFPYFDLFNRKIKCVKDWKSDLGVTFLCWAFAYI